MVRHLRVSEFLPMAKDQSPMHQQMPPRRQALLLFLGLACVLSGLLLAIPAWRHVQEASRMGYVEVGMRKARGSAQMAWTARHTANDSPVRFYATLVPYISAPLSLVMLGIVAWLGLITTAVGGPGAIPVGGLRTVMLAAGVIGACAVWCTIFFWMPLR